MYVSSHKSAKGVLLGLVLFLTGAASMFTIAVDNDDDAETPAVIIEMQLAPFEKNLHVAQLESTVQLNQVEGALPQTAAPAFTDDHGVVTVTIERALPLMVPLRT
jgi:hypothetical protein